MLDGDEVFQPRKLDRSRLYEAVDVNTLIGNWSEHHIAVRSILSFMWQTGTTAGQLFSGIRPGWKR